MDGFGPLGKQNQLLKRLNKKDMLRDRKDLMHE